MTTADQLRAEGEARGQARGRADSLIEQLGLKFGEPSADTTALVRAGDLQQLRVWAAKILTAGSLEEVFAE